MENTQTGTSMKKIKAKAAERPVREEPNITATVSDIVAAVNAGLNPGGPIYNWFEGDPDAAAAVTIRDGTAEVTNPGVICGGFVEEQTASELKVVAYNTPEGGVYAEGPETHAVLENSVICAEGPGQGLGGPGTAVSVRNGATLELHDCFIDTHGKNRFCTTAEYGSTLRVYDSVLYSHGIPYGEDIPPVEGIMATPPPALEILGNARTHCTMTNSYSYFYDSRILCDGWGALSTEGAEGYVYIEANKCDVICTKSGYGAYLDPNCHGVFNECSFDTAAMAVIVAGESDAVFQNCSVYCGSYFGLFHTVNGEPEEVGSLTASDCVIKTKKEVARVRSHNTVLMLENCEVRTENGILIHTIVNDDPCTTDPGDHPYGNHVFLTDMYVEGDCIHEDTGRRMWIELTSATLRGAIVNANLALDGDSRWFATADSFVTLTGDVLPDQIDAPEGVVIRAVGGETGEYELPSGGKLILTE